MQEQNFAPNWYTDEALQTVKKGYLLEGETVYDMYARLAHSASAYYPNGLNELSQRELETYFNYLFEMGWFSPASPVAANLGTNRGLPVSCYGQNVSNSINSIFGNIHEGAMLSKNGGGLGINLSNVHGNSNITTWAKGFDYMANSVSQGGVRRGAVAIYLDIWHKDIDNFLHGKDLLRGDHREKLDCNIAVIIDNRFMAELKQGNARCIDLFTKILELRMKTGSPYLMFKDNAQDADPECYKQNGLKTEHTQLCSEIFLHSDEEHTYTCVLSSLNLDKWFEWNEFSYKGFTVPMLAIAFLDAVNSEFIQNAKHKDGFAKAVRSAEKGRALALGTMGLHNLYMQQNLPFDSPEAYSLNKSIHSYIAKEAKKATQLLAKELGEPEWCKGFGIRNTHLLAIAPTTTNSVLCDAGTPGIEPQISNYYVMAGAKGSFIRKNKYLAKLLKNDESWEQIRLANGSVQGLAELTDYQKRVFRTAYEIDQEHIIRQAADRQEFICQGQSLNLFFYDNANAKQIIDIHILAHELGLKSLYYVRSTSPMNAAISSNRQKPIVLYSRPDCIYCKRAKQLLEQKQLPFTEYFKAEGRVPQIWIDGEMLEDGFNSLKQLLVPDAIKADANSCTSCEG